MKWYFAQQTLFYCWTFRFETAVGKCKERFSSVFFFLVCTQPHQPPPRENQMFWCRSRSCPWSLCVHLKMEKRQSEGREGSDYFWITRANDLEWATRQKVGFGCSFHWQMLPFVKSGLDSQDSQLCNQSTLIHKWDSHEMQRPHSSGSLLPTIPGVSVQDCSGMGQYFLKGF